MGVDGLMLEFWLLSFTFCLAVTTVILCCIWQNELYPDAPKPILFIGNLIICLVPILNIVYSGVILTAYLLYDQVPNNPPALTEEEIKKEKRRDYQRRYRARKRAEENRYKNKHELMDI